MRRNNPGENLSYHCNRCDIGLVDSYQKCHYGESLQLQRITDTIEIMKISMNISLDEIVSKLAAIGVPSLILLLTMTTTGLAGAAAMTASLALLGPGGMLGGVVTLLAGGVFAEVLAKFGIETVTSLVIAKMYQNGKTQEEIEMEIRKFPLSNNLKIKLIDKFKELQSDNPKIDSQSEF